MKIIKFIIAMLAFIVFLVIVLCLLLWYGIIHFNNPPRDAVIGVDVSSYQGDIDWKVLSSQNISFAFIKATEGSSFVDPCFKDNWVNAADTNLRIGAYHFFSFESTGEKQAELFCSTVTPVDNMLPPVIDVEFYGRFQTEEDINVVEVKNELRTLVDSISVKYGMKPIIYASKRTYNAIVKNDFSDCDLWLRSIYFSVPNEIDATFWQFSNRHRLKGYNGEETYIDMNVFCRDREEFANYPS